MYVCVANTAILGESVNVSAVFTCVGPDLALPPYDTTSRTSLSNLTLSKRKGSGACDTTIVQQQQSMVAMSRPSSYIYSVHTAFLANDELSIPVTCVTAAFRPSPCNGQTLIIVCMTQLD